MKDLENDDLENKKRTAKPKKVTPNVHKAKMKILIPKIKIEDAIKCHNTEQAYKIFRDILDYDTSVHWK